MSLLPTSHKTAMLLAWLLLLGGCATQRKIDSLRSHSVGAGLVPSAEQGMPDRFADSIPCIHRDTLKVQDPEGHEVLIMKAVKDEDGEMVATDVIDAAYVTARFRNVAERHGKVDIGFRIIVPESLQDSRWQIRFSPEMYILDDTLGLDPVIITGKDYRKAQLKGYQQYRRFLDSIVNDTTRFIDSRQLEVFLERNLPEIFAFRNDSSEVSDEAFASHFGVTQKEAIDHYTNRIAMRWNERRKSRTDLMFKRYVKVPILSEGLRLDTVMQAINGDFIYDYIQTINTRPKLRKVDISLSGSIYEQDKMVYGIPKGDALTFYISSISSFVDGTQRFLTKVIERRVEANTACYVDFASGKSDINPDMGHNRAEIGRIKSNLAALMTNTVFDLDSIIVSASASPEGSVDANNRLSRARSASIAAYLDGYMRHFRDSLAREEGLSYNLDEDYPGKGNAAGNALRFISRSNGENWQMLDRLVEADTTLSAAQKESYFMLAQMKDADAREARMKQEDSYRHLRENLYPRLRTVRFDFHLHRKGMQKDTVHTTVPDTLYMQGVQAIRDRDYAEAVKLLRPYADFNTAIAYCALDYNASALSILEGLEHSPQVCYMLALVKSRMGDDQAAVQYYLDACSKEPSFIHRGNLDPEISAIVKRYGLASYFDDKEESF